MEEQQAAEDDGGRGWDSSLFLVWFFFLFVDSSCDSDRRSYFSRWKSRNYTGRCRAAKVGTAGGDGGSSDWWWCGGASGTGSGVGDGRIEFNESFRLPLTLLQEMSINGGDGDTYQKNCLGFNLYEPRRDKMVKGLLLGSAVLDLAAYGVIKENLSISGRRCGADVRDGR